MKNIIGVRFKKQGKIYFFDSGNIEIAPKDKVIVETSMGQELGEVVVNKRQFPDYKLNTQIKKIIRKADKKDLKHYEENKKKEKEAFKICK